MSSAKSIAIALTGIGGDRVDVEAHIASGLPKFLLVGLPDTALGEALDRVRAALQSTGCSLPADRVTVNLSPASLRKHGSGFDLAIAVSVLAASGVIDTTGPARTVHVGELGLDGTVRPVPGILPVVAAAARAGAARVMVPAASAAEASLVEGVEVLPVASLRAAAMHYGADAETLADEPAESPTSRQHSSTSAVAASGRSAPLAHATSSAAGRDLADVVGNDEAVRALVIAAAGGHHLLMVGPPGAGKTMLAERLVDVLPDLEVERAIEVAAVRSLRGLTVTSPLDRRPPMQAPHHTASTAALLGGGSGAIRPGAVSLATNGVLFLDEAPEFSRDVLDSMRQSLESGRHVVHRAAGVAEFPAAYQLVLAANPCPCGNAGSIDQPCMCTPMQQRRYLARLSGPLLDRVDVQLRVERVSGAMQRVAQAELEAGRASGMTTAEARGRVCDARAAAHERLASTPWRTNRQVSGKWLRSGPVRLPPSETSDLDRALDRGLLTMRGYDRVLRVAWSIADLDGAGRPGRGHLREALFYRMSTRALT
ncbi:hypothetical protein GCM10011490_25690 [Pseudoclavibacter endophyticus]|uniref:YifB family Mg chelatase-like AAA ATPase n=1 Tax=Pseudoclavibacter endophyticus TaxID=1778590 RepID=A0A6H9WKD1_9MICO|nr:YifB family Mg chelatase-like AAA ATPase [Pseudoclavibacter endophyticus]KAB1647892.1 YifB family Mg chelatase-like AAA ATPase [Pseudoclavibacter endophyticus]GGA73676.1 hypothetical protein GCM10011490_25690 [Pseudoclavibacter endophyticus]